MRWKHIYPITIPKNRENEKGEQDVVSLLINGQGISLGDGKTGRKNRERKTTQNDGMIYVNKSIPVPHFSLEPLEP